MAIKLLIGGSPCTYWSIAQKNNRETEAEGLGWELFKNYLIAKEKFKPDFFLYENNKSATKAIKEQISRELGVELMHINSALVSAQNRERFYAFNWEVEQPKDRGILLRDILETGEDLTSREKSYRLTASYGGAAAWNTIERAQRTMVVEPIGETNGKAYCLTASTGSMATSSCAVNKFEMVDYTPRENSHIVINQNAIRCAQDKNNASCAESFVEFTDKKAQTLTTAHKPKIIESAKGHNTNSKTTIYEVKNGLITIKGKQYPIKLADGFYIIRKLTVTECCRLQTMPDDYCRAVSNAQAYKGLGNGWTAEVIIHILNGALANVPRDEEIIVLSMYDGIGTGRYCLDKMGFTNVKYYAYEIDKYAKQIALSNYPDIIQCGDAFDLRNPDWTIGY